MTVYLVDCDELDALAAATAHASGDIYWALAPLEFGQGAVPWQRDTQVDWSHIKTRIKTEIQQLDDETRQLRDRANRARWEAAKRAMFSAAPAWLVVFPAVPLAAIFGVLGSGAFGWEGAKASEVELGDPAPHAVPPFVIQDQIVAKEATPLEIFVGKYDKNGSHLDDGSEQHNYPGECVSLVKNYMRTVLHEPGNLVFRGGGPNWEWDNPQAFSLTRWDKIPSSDIQNHGGYKPGDVVFFNWGREAPPKKHDYEGHIGIVTGIDSRTGEVLVFQQNSPQYAQAEVKPFAASNFVGVMRKK